MTRELRGSESNIHLLLGLYVGLTFSSCVVVRDLVLFLGRREIERLPDIRPSISKLYKDRDLPKMKSDLTLASCYIHLLIQHIM